MAGDKYLYNNAGAITEKAAIQTSAGAGDSGKIPAVDSTGRLDPTFLPTGVGADIVTVLASEALAAGDLVNIYNNAGTANCRKADASTTGKEAWGYVIAAVLISASAQVYLGGLNPSVTGLTPGKQYLSDTVPGKSTVTVATGAGHIVQIVGVANTATSLQFDPQGYVVLA